MTTRLAPMTTVALPLDVWCAVGDALGRSRDATALDARRLASTCRVGRAAARVATRRIMRARDDLLRWVAPTVAAIARYRHPDAVRSSHISARNVEAWMPSHPTLQQLRVATAKRLLCAWMRVVGAAVLTRPTASHRYASVTLEYNEMMHELGVRVERADGGVLAATWCETHSSHWDAEADDDDRTRGQPSGQTRWRDDDAEAVRDGVAGVVASWLRNTDGHGEEDDGECDRGSRVTLRFDRQHDDERGGDQQESGERIVVTHVDAAATDLIAEAARAWPRETLANHVARIASLRIEWERVLREWRDWLDYYDAEGWTQ